MTLNSLLCEKVPCSELTEMSESHFLSIYNSSVNNFFLLVFLLSGLKFHGKLVLYILRILVLAYMVKNLKIKRSSIRSNLITFEPFFNP